MSLLITRDKRIPLISFQQLTNNKYDKDAIYDRMGIIPNVDEIAEEKELLGDNLRVFGCQDKWEFPAELQWRAVGINSYII